MICRHKNLKSDWFAQKHECLDCKVIFKSDKDMREARSTADTDTMIHLLQIIADSCLAPPEPEAAEPQKAKK